MRCDRVGSCRDLVVKWSLSGWQKVCAHTQVNDEEV